MDVSHVMKAEAFDVDAMEETIALGLNGV